MRGVMTFILAATAAPLAAQAVTAASQQQPSDPFVTEQAHKVIESLATALDENFVFPDKGKAYALMLRANLAAGKYDSFVDARAFADRVTADLQAVHKDGHLSLQIVPPADREGPEGEPNGPPAKSAVIKSGWLASGVAYIRFDLFPGDEATLADVRKFLETHKDAKTLIIDARAHRGGGLAEMDLIFPQLFAAPTTLVAMDTRLAAEQRRPNPMPEASLRKVDAPESIVRREHFVTPAAQQGALSKAKVYLLISKRTASAAEHLSLSLKRTHRATLIGETTRGAGHYGGMAPLDETFTYAAFIPVGRTFDPDTGKGWEGDGVKPDIEVPAERALDEALKLAGIQLTSEVALASLK